MRRLFFVMATVFAAFSAPAIAADAPPNGTRTGLTYEKKPVCTTPLVTMENLIDAYYTRSQDDFAAQLNRLLTGCDVFGSIKDEYVVVMFPATPTQDPASAITIIHGIFHRTGGATAMLSAESMSFPGIASATWVYLTDDMSDIPRTQLLSLRLGNPNLALIGSLAEKVIPKLAGVTSTREAEKVYVHVASAVKLPFKRSTITETDFIQREIPGDKGPTSKEIAGSATFSNTPNTWLTINAGVAILSGEIQGAQRLKVDGDKYISDPLSRAVTMAGVTFHLPYDSTTPEPTWREKFGMVVAGILTPAGGLAVGPSYGWRGFAFAVTYGWIWVDTAPGGKGAGDDAVAGEQLVSGKSHGVLIGGTYTFGG